MPSYFDIYVISHVRDTTTIDGFLDEFLPNRRESADEYEYPQYNDSAEETFHEALDIIEICCADESSEYALYWGALNSKKPEHAMVFFLKDGNVIFGLSTDDAYPDYAKELLGMMKIQLKTTLGYIGHEASPSASNLTEFQAEIEAHRGLFDTLNRS